MKSQEDQRRQPWTRALRRIFARRAPSDPRAPASDAQFHDPRIIPVAGPGRSIKPRHAERSRPAQQTRYVEALIESELLRRMALLRRVRKTAADRPDGGTPEATRHRERMRGNQTGDMSTAPHITIVGDGAPFSLAYLCARESASSRSKSGSSDNSSRRAPSGTAPWGGASKSTGCRRAPHRDSDAG